MASKEITRPEGSAYELLKAAKTDAERFEAGQYAVTKIEVPGFDLPVPRFFFDLPWVPEGDEVFESMLATMAAADDIDAASAERELVSAEDLVGKPVRVLGGMAQRSDLEEGSQGAYLWLTVSVEGGPPQLVLTGAAEVCVLFWRKYCAGQVPFDGRFITRGQGKKGRKPPIGFAVEAPL